MTNASSPAGGVSSSISSSPVLITDCTSTHPSLKLLRRQEVDPLVLRCGQNHLELNQVDGGLSGNTLHITFLHHPQKHGVYCGSALVQRNYPFHRPEGSHTETVWKKFNRDWTSCRHLRRNNLILLLIIFWIAVIYLSCVGHHYCGV